MSTSLSDTNHNSLFSEDDYDFTKAVPERKRQGYFLAILPLLIVLVIAGVILVISLIVYPNLREDIDTDSQEELSYFFQISDLHIDLQYQNASYPLGQYGVDSGTLLLNKTLEAMIETNPNPLFILLTGDIVAHNRNSSEQQFGTIQRVTEIIQDYFPTTTVYPALGNNDVYPDYHYAINTSSDWMNNLTSLWSVWLNDDQQETFRQYGYYKVDPLWEGGPNMLVLNSLIYSSWLVDSNNPNVTTPTPPSDLPDDPNGQFQWIISELESAKSSNQQVLFHYHIPPGVNSYDSSEQWHDKFRDQFLAICSNYSDVILAQFAAHFHTDDFRLYGNTSILLNPSVSPDHYNNPTFRLHVVSQDVLINYIQYYTDLVAYNLRLRVNQTFTFSQEYNLQSVYGIDHVGYSSFQDIFTLVKTSTPHYLQYYAHKYAFYAAHRDELLCSVLYANLTTYENCVSSISDDE